MQRRQLLIALAAFITQPPTREGAKLNAIQEKERIKKYERLTADVNTSLRMVATADGLPTPERRSYYRQLGTMHQEWAELFTELAEMK